ncbi:hypothetical protein PDPE_1-03165 [Photobacterium damselae subsp. piscicida]|nr:hypothetical protein PDPE_1-03165 [Photobacterium damselae subsp. piscicida]
MNCDLIDPVLATRLITTLNYDLQVLTMLLIPYLSISLAEGLW